MLLLFEKITVPVFWEAPPAEIAAPPPAPAAPEIQIVLGPPPAVDCDRVMLLVPASTQTTVDVPVLPAVLPVFDKPKPGTAGCTVCAATDAVSVLAFRPKVTPLRLENDNDDTDAVMIELLLIPKVTPLLLDSTTVEPAAPVWVPAATWLKGSEE